MRQNAKWQQKQINNKPTKKEPKSQNLSIGVLKRRIVPSKIVPARAEEAKSKKNASNGSDESGGEAIFGVTETMGRRGKGWIWMGE